VTGIPFRGICPSRGAGVEWVQLPHGPMVMMKAQQQLETLALQALEVPANHATAARQGKDGWTAIQEATATVSSFLSRSCRGHDWNMPLLTEVLLDWATQDPLAYAGFVEKVTKSPEQQDLSRLEGLWTLQSILSWLADDHNYVLEDREDVFRLRDQGDVVPFQSLIHPTALALRIVAHRRLQLPPEEICPAHRCALSA
jgi:hypothetical protein